MMNNKEIITWRIWGHVSVCQQGSFIKGIKSCCSLHSTTAVINIYYVIINVDKIVVRHSTFESNLSRNFEILQSLQHKNNRILFVNKHDKCRSLYKFCNIIDMSFYGAYALLPHSFYLQNLHELVHFITNLVD